MDTFSNSRIIPGLVFPLSLWPRYFPSSSYISEDTRRYKHIKMYKYVFARAMCAGALARVRTWIPQPSRCHALWSVCEERRLSKPALVVLSSSCPPWWGPPHAIDTCDTGQHKEAAKLVSCLQKVGSKLSTHPLGLKPNWGRNRSFRFCFSLIDFRSEIYSRCPPISSGTWEAKN